MRFLAITIAVGHIATPELAGAQTKSKETPIAASRFGILVDGVQKPKNKGLKSPSSKKGGGTKSYKLENAWPKKVTKQFSPAWTTA